ncbi:hypothetical protein [Flavobacterium pallidum]|uniref:Uncharacterized protein n=1 Tax=Flavobacterium pallidum TaxID=2172098 RepID=A0A2S1SJ79_9FLAO|nr:hypothetical protein [Flavobacterium pallidum]AWI26445.1 hypothetical protein HYN49_11330 [Flavobacterium pallidum]
MKNIILVSIFLLSCFIVTAQDSKIPKGNITLITGQNMEFTDLKFIDDKVKFTNLDTKSDFEYFLTAVKTIIDENGVIIYQKAQAKEEPKFTPQISVAPEHTPSPPLVEALQFKNIENIRKNGKKLTPEEIRTLLAQNAYALDAYNRGKKTAWWGNFTLGFGIGMFVGGAIINLSSSDEVDQDGNVKAKGSPAPLVIGIASALISIPLKVSGRKNVKEAISAYSENRTYAFKPEWRVVAGMSQAGIALRF